MIKIAAAGWSDQGCVRKRNEDRILVDSDRGVFAVADGLGGELCGDIAAEAAVRAVEEYVLRSNEFESSGWPYPSEPSLSKTQNRAVNAIRFANSKVWGASQTLPDCVGMGSTISALFIQNDTATIGSIGDSRVYLYRDGRMQQMTRDDAVVSDLVEAGKITAEEAKSHPMRHVLTLTLGHYEDVAVQLVEFILRAGDRLLLATDGLHGPVADADTMRIIETVEDPQVTAKALIAAAIERGGPDNVSCILVACI